MKRQLPPDLLNHLTKAQKVDASSAPVFTKEELRKFIEERLEPFKKEFPENVQEFKLADAVYEKLKKIIEDTGNYKIFKEITGISSITRQLGISIGQPEVYKKWRGNVSFAPSVKEDFEKYISLQLEMYKKELPPNNPNGFKPIESICEGLIKIKRRCHTTNIFSKISGLGDVNTQFGITIRDINQYRKWRGDVSFQPTILDNSKTKIDIFSMIQNTKLANNPLTLPHSKAEVAADDENFNDFVNNLKNEAILPKTFFAETNNESDLNSSILRLKEFLSASENVSLSNESSQDDLKNESSHLDLSPSNKYFR